MPPPPRLFLGANLSSSILQRCSHVGKTQPSRHAAQFLLSRFYATGKPHIPARPPQHPKPNSNAGAPLYPHARPSIINASSKTASKSTSPQAKARNLPVKKDAEILPFAGTRGTLPSTASSASSSSTKAASGYPERLLIYHAGTARTAFIASVKLTSIFVFIAGAVFVAPLYYYDPATPDHVAGLIVLIGAIPMGIMVLTTAPFVTYVHLTLPAWARMSAARLHRMAGNLPASAVVDITTLRWIWPRVTRLTAGELYLKSGAVTGAMTLRRRIPQTVLEQRKWWQWKPLSTFYVAGKGGKTAEKGVWEEAMTSVSKGWGLKERARVMK